MYRDKVIIVNRKSELYSYFVKMCTNSKNLKNVTNFYIRQCMTGLKKSPELRQPNETEVLHYVFTNVSKINFFNYLFFLSGTKNFTKIVIS